jgi:hypothetical protein
MIGGERPDVIGVCLALQVICDRRGIKARIVPVTDSWGGADNSESEVEIPKIVWSTACAAVDPDWGLRVRRVN